MQMTGDVVGTSVPACAWRRRWAELWILFLDAAEAEPLVLVAWAGMGVFLCVVIVVVCSVEIHIFGVVAYLLNRSIMNTCDSLTKE